MTQTNKLQSVVADAVASVDERHDGYRANLGRAITQILQAQDTTTSDASRGREIDRIISAVGEQLSAATKT